MTNQTGGDSRKVFRNTFITKLLAHIGAIMSAGTVSFFLFIAATGGLYVCMRVFGEDPMQCKAALDLSNPEWIIEGFITVIHSPLAVLVLTLTGTAEVEGMRGILYLVEVNHTDS